MRSISLSILCKIKEPVLTTKTGSQISIIGAASGRGYSLLRSRQLLFPGLEDDFILHQIHEDRIAIFELAAQQGIRQPVFDLLLDYTPQRTGTHIRIITQLSQHLQGCRCGGKVDLVFL